MPSTSTPPALPSWLVWRQSAFPDCNMVLIKGALPTLVDSGFVGNAEQTVAWAVGEAPSLARMVNTHWHSDHVGGNARLQALGVEIVASEADAEALALGDAGACYAEYLDQPVAPYRVDRMIRPGEQVRMGDLDWEVLATPGHTPSHLSFWQPEERVLIAGDVLSTYDVGWINVALDGPWAAQDELESIERLASLGARWVLPGHGPIPSDVDAVFAGARRRIQRLVEDPRGSIWYGAKRVFGFALIIYDGVSERELPAYLRARAWAQDAARLLGMSVDDFGRELIQGMLESGGVELRDGRIRSTAPYTPVDPSTMRVPFPRDWGQALR